MKRRNRVDATIDSLNTIRNEFNELEEMLKEKKYEIGHECFYKIDSTRIIINRNLEKLLHLYIEKRGNE